MSLRLGEIQKLEIVKKVEFGVYLAEPGREDDKVLLPIKQVPAGASVGDVMEVFLYKDSKDRDHETPEAHHGRGNAAYRGTDGKDRCFSGLGSGEGPASSL